MLTPGNLFFSIVFSSVGLAAFVYGKKSGSIKPIILGIALMAYPYFISQTWLMVLVGCALTAGLFVWKD
ncbi:MAG TPA: hypothetical protein VIM48_00330 [Chthoniobacterales bacterium]